MLTALALGPEIKASERVPLLRNLILLVAALFLMALSMEPVMRSLPCRGTRTFKERGGLEGAILSFQPNQVLVAEFEN